eukprot:maker-scaffold_10-snap-gene-10.43-mRNA-1 protein AED:0.00 eAED:0.00 QI:126/1/1/1/0/0/2/870/99
MSRGNQRDKDRERALQRKAKNAKKKGSTAPKVGGKNADAEALQAKIAAKKAAMEAGEIKKKKNLGNKNPGGPKTKSLVNPHTGKKDLAYTKKMLAKQKT